MTTDEDYFPEIETYTLSYPRNRNQLSPNATSELSFVPLSDPICYLPKQLQCTNPTQLLIEKFKEAHPVKQSAAQSLSSALSPRTLTHTNYGSLKTALMEDQGDNYHSLRPYGNQTTSSNNDKSVNKLEEVQTRARGGSITLLDRPFTSAPG
jgi:hypothetical protein